MAFYQTVLADRIVGTSAGSSPGTGWTSVASLPAMITNARTANLPLFLLPGTYTSTQIDVNSGNPLTLIGVVGQTIIQLSAVAPYLFYANGINNVIIQNIIFDGNNIALSDTSASAGLVKFSGTAANKFLLQDCIVHNTTQAGISCASGCSGDILRNIIYSCDRGIYCVDSSVNIERNNVGYCNNNGVMIYTSTQTSNNSNVKNNYVNNISDTSGGTGNLGNGISVFRAIGVKVEDNNIYNCAFSAIRFDAAGDGIVSGNFCSTSGEVAIWFESPGSGTSLTGGVCANNIIEGAGGGIAVANVGLASDGVTRRVTIIGNQISGINSVYIPNAGKYTDGCGISAEGSVAIIGNIVDTASNGGIIAGTNNAAIDIVISGNFVRGTPMGIGYSQDGAAVGILISSNEISGYTNISNPSNPSYIYSGAIVSVTFDGTFYKRYSSGGVANTDYGNATQTTVGAITVGMNKAH